MGDGFHVGCWRQRPQLEDLALLQDATEGAYAKWHRADARQDSGHIMPLATCPAPASMAERYSLFGSRTVKVVPFPASLLTAMTP